MRLTVSIWPTVEVGPIVKCYDKLSMQWMSSYDAGRRIGGGHFLLFMSTVYAFEFLQWMGVSYRVSLAPYSSCMNELLKREKCALQKGLTLAFHSSCRKGTKRYDQRLNMEWKLQQMVIIPAVMNML